MGGEGQGRWQKEVLWLPACSLLNYPSSRSRSYSSLREATVPKTALTPTSGPCAFTQNQPRIYVSSYPSANTLHERCTCQKPLPPPPGCRPACSSATQLLSPLLCGTNSFWGVEWLRQTEDKASIYLLA